MSKPSDLTISDVACELRIRRQAVLRHLKAGNLQGYDVTAPGARRKSYRITRDALDAFKASRSAAQQTSTSRRDRRLKQENYVEYF